MNAGLKACMEANVKATKKALMNTNINPNARAVNTNEKDTLSYFCIKKCGLVVGVWGI